MKNLKGKKPEKKISAAAELGRRGGKAIAKRGPDYMRKIGKKGAKARWKDNDKSDKSK